MKNHFLVSIALVLTININAQQLGTFKDSRDGKTYKTIKIGNQVWMAENLAYKANSGCWAYENNTTNVAKYGYLYLWETAKKVCPSGWHLPSELEWTTMIDNLGGKKVAGEKMKSTSGWNENGNGTNSSGFTGLPGGNRDGGGNFSSLGMFGSWWDSTPGRAFGNWSGNSTCDLSIVSIGGLNKGCALSVRCIKD